MKITFVLPSMGISGGVRVVIEYANHLVKQGHEVIIIYPFLLSSQMILRIDPKHFFIKKFFYKLMTSLRFLKRPIIIKGNGCIDSNIKLVEIPTLNEKYIPDADVIVATWWETALYINRYGKTKGEKFYLVQGYEVWGGPKAIVKNTYNLNFKKIVVSQFLYDKLLELGIPKDQINHISNGINSQNFKITRPIKNREKRVAMQFNQNVFKGSIDGINALKIVKHAFPNLKAVLFGIHPRPKYLPNWMKYFENPSKVELLEEIYNKSNIYLCPSWTEGWGLPGAEAMACGCALVSTDNGGVNDYAIHGKTALLSPIKDPNQLAKNVSHLLNHENYRIKLAQDGYKHIKKFTWEKSASQLENLFCHEIKQKK